MLSLIPGGGYMYLGLMNRGLQAMMIFFGSIFLASVANLGVFAGMVIPVLMFYSIFDTLQLASQMNEGLFIEDKPYVDIGSPNWQNILGYILIGLGILALFYNVLNNLPPAYTIPGVYPHTYPASSSNWYHRCVLSPSAPTFCTVI